MTEQLEREFEDAIVELFKICGWMVHHTRPAMSKKGWRTPIKGHRGFPDLVLARDGDVIFAELKRNTKVKPTEHQLAWLTALKGRHLGSHDAYLWTPDDWPVIEAMAKRTRKETNP